MRLITVRMKDLVVKNENGVNYSILSHRWGDDEVSFQEIIQSPELVHKKAGWLKILKCCEQAERGGLLYVWVNTCCTIQSHHW